MRTILQCMLVASAIYCGARAASGGEFYSRFLSLVDTNAPGALPISSPLLIDTNNVGAKLANSIVNLSDACSKGEIGGVRLGMTMEEVADLWGKPRSFWGRCFGGPNFWYEDANVIFDPSSNSVMRITIKKVPRLHGGLSASSSADQFEAVLGKPAARKQRNEFDQLEVAYQSPRSALRLMFSEGRLQYFELVRRPLNIQKDVR